MAEAQEAWLTRLTELVVTARAAAPSRPRIPPGRTGEVAQGAPPPPPLRQPAAAQTPLPPAPAAVHPRAEPTASPQVRQAVQVKLFDIADKKAMAGEGRQLVKNELAEPSCSGPALKIWHDPCV